MSLRRQNPLTG